MRRPSQSSSPAAGRSATRYLLALAIVATLAVCAVAVPPLLQDLARAPARSEAEAAAARMADTVGRRLAADRARLEALARHFELADAITQDDLAMLGRLAGLYRAAFPQALRLMIVPGPRLNPAPDADPPIGYALVDLLDRAVAQRRTAVEVHYPGQPQAHINMVAPVLEAGEPVGALVLSQPLEMLRAALSSPTGAQRTLIQEVDGTRASILTLGASDGGLVVSAPIPGSPWQLSYTTGVGPEPLAPVIALVLALIAIVATALIAGHRLDRALRADATALARLARGEETALPRLRQMTVAAAAIGERRAPPPPQPGAPAPRTPTPPRPSPPPGTPAFGGPSVDGMEVTELPEHSADASVPTDTPVIDPSILRAYDVRGVVGTTLTVEAVRQLGQAIGSEAAARDQREVVVGYDGRHSSPELTAALTDGLLAAGRHVIDIGRVPTPVMHFATHHLGTRTGVEVTGSHNPSEYNGLKIVVDGETLSGDAIQRLGQRIATADLVTGEGQTSQHDVLDAYIERIVRDITLHRPLKVVLDCGNGVTGVVAPALFEALGCEVETLYAEVDGDFPNHHPDPTVPENLAALIHYVRLQQADIGLAFDGDGDRLGVVDERGSILWADRQLMLFARDILEREPGSDIIFDVKCSNLLGELITENAGLPIMWKTGHSLIRQKLHETGAPLAGEMSGHIFFNDRWYGFDDGLYAGARLLEILSLDGRAASELFNELPQGISTPEIRITLPEGDPERIVHRLLDAADGFPDARITTTDGLRVDFPDGWGLVRASNTQPCLVLRFEGHDETALERIQTLFRERLRNARPDLTLPF